MGKRIRSLSAPESGWWKDRTRYLVICWVPAYAVSAYIFVEFDVLENTPDIHCVEGSPG